MAEAPEAEERPLRPRQCRKYLQKTLATEFRAIVQGFVEEARNGSCAHMKLVVELLDAGKDGEPKKGSAQRLLDELGE
jgi:hypothetical protein